MKGRIRIVTAITSLEANPLPDQDFPDATHIAPDVSHDAGPVTSVAVAPPGSCPALRNSPARRSPGFRPASAVYASGSLNCPLTSRGWSSFVAMTFLWSGFRVLVMGSARSATGVSPPDLVVDARRAGLRALPLCLVRSSVARFPMTCTLLTRFSRLTSVFVPRSPAVLATFGVLA